MIPQRYFRFSLRFLLCAPLVAAIALAWFCAAYNRHRNEGQTLDRLESTGGTIHKSTREPEWLWERFGDQIANKGESLILSDTEIGDDELAEIARLSGLGGLYLKRTNVTDKGLASIEDMTDLVALSLRRTSITKAPPVARMARLEHLDLAFTNVDDINTAGLMSLEHLNLRATRITDQTLAKIGTLPDLRTLDIAGAPGRPMKITDEGVAHLTKAKLPKLRTIYLYYSEVTDDEIGRLRAAFPGLKVYR